MPALFHNLPGNFTHGSLLSTMVMSLVRTPLADAAKNDLVVPDSPVPLTAAGADDKETSRASMSLRRPHGSQMK
jgi:hypothetical protein